LLGSVFLAMTPIAVDRFTPEGRARAGLQMKFRPKCGDPPEPEELQELDAKELKLHSIDPEDRAYKMLQHEIKLQRAYLAKRPMDTPYPPLMVYPEGTTTSDAYLLQFKRGAFTSGMPVQPVVVKYPYCNFEVVWSCDMPVWWMAIRMLCQVCNFMTVHYLDVYYPSDAEKADPQLYANNVRAAMCEAMPGTVMTEHSFEDTRLLAKAQGMYKSSNPGVTTDLPYSEIRSAYKLTLDETLKLLQKFRDADSDGNGHITQDEFATMMNLDADCATTESYFQLMDPEGHGYVNFQSFLQGVVVASEVLDRKEKVKMVFHLYDADNSGDISYEEIVQIMESHKHPTALLTEGTAKIGQIQSETSIALATAVMAGRERIKFGEFETAVNSHPELMTFALDLVDSLWE